MEEDGQHGGETMRRNTSASAINVNCANNLHNSHNNDKKWEMTYFRKSGQNVLTSAVGSACICISETSDDISCGISVLP